MITSRSNKKVVAIRKLRHRKERELADLFFVEGLRAVGEAVQLGADLETLVVAPQLLKSEFGREMVTAGQARGVDCLELSADVFASLSVKDHPQGLGAVVRQAWGRLGVEKGRGLEDALWVALSGVADPGNLGTILRTSEAVGARGVILVGETTDPYDPSCVRASMGAVFSQRLVRTDLTGLGAWAREAAHTVVGTLAEGSVHYREADYGRRTVLFMGSERQGLGARELGLCDCTVRIPMVGRTDSLNLAVATAVILYEIFAHRTAERS